MWTAWAHEETTGENEKSERKTGIVMPVTSGREEAKFLWEQEQ